MYGRCQNTLDYTSVSVQNIAHDLSLNSWGLCTQQQPDGTDNRSSSFHRWEAINHGQWEI